MQLNEDHIRAKALSEALVSSIASLATFEIDVMVLQALEVTTGGRYQEALSVAQAQVKSLQIKIRYIREALEKLSPRVEEAKEQITA